ncbi:monocarboxylate transporter 12-B-like isoform X2 [Archocentrus centrarchus]|uniref:monocarboxylate transporter 12-B-like isoform X2 n=1 Tax=Archocentrus centrarchus TaxID=63155 RepID=UPI0011E9B339|nr:monocarboxylate transporter 12-B-like isoform X2 [Archocentrus centrarchus]
MAAGMAVTKQERLDRGKTASGVLTPPEGGWGWMIVIGCFLATICTRAVTRCVSMFFVEFQMHFEKDYSNTAWIHSLIDSTTMLCAPLGSFLGNRLSCRATVILGGVLSSAGLILSSFANSLEYLYMSLGVLTGSGIGTFLLAPAVQLLIEYYSWRGALLILGAFVSNLCVCGALMRPLEPRGGQKTWESKLANLGKNCMKTVLDFKVPEQVSVDCSEVDHKQLEVKNLKDPQGLLIPNGTLKNFGLEKDKLGQRNIAFLPTLELSNQTVIDLKIGKCFLFSNTLTDTMLGNTEFSDLKLSNMTEDLKLVESISLNKNLVDMDVKIEDSELNEARQSDNKPLVNASARGQCSCFKSREEFGFLFIPSFLILSISFLFMAYGCSPPVVYLVPYALSLGVQPQHAAFLVSVFGVCGIVGNITFGWVTDRGCVRRFRVLSYTVAMAMEGLCCMFMPFLHSFTLLVPFSVLYGYFDGAYVALIPVVTSDIVGSTYLTSALGVVYFLHAIPYLLSPPIGGWLVDQTGNYAATFFLSGASFIFSSAILMAAMLIRHCQRSKLNSAAHLNPSHKAAAVLQGIL